MNFVKDTSTPEPYFGCIELDEQYGILGGIYSVVRDQCTWMTYKLCTWPEQSDERDV